MYFLDTPGNGFSFIHVNAIARFTSQGFTAQLEKNTFIFEVAHNTPLLLTHRRVDEIIKMTNPMVGHFNID
jgi:hypothetical protein